MSKVVMMSDRVYRFWCPGCMEYHTVHVNGHRNKEGATWEFNMDLEFPTFKPAINLRTGTYADPHWVAPNSGPNSSVVCYSRVRGGKIEYRDVTTHLLSGMATILPEL